MSKYEKWGEVTFSPTAITDKEEVYDLYKKPSGSGICDWNTMINKPFYAKTEMVEIVSEQRVVGHSAGGDGSLFGASVIGTQLLVAGRTYTIVINGKQNEMTAEDDYGEVIISRSDFEIVNDSGTEVVDNQIGVGWSVADYGETITFAIYEKQEIVKQIDPKFVGGTLFYSNPDDAILYKDEKFSEAVTNEDIRKLLGSSMAISSYGGLCWYVSTVKFEEGRYFIVQCYNCSTNSVLNFYTAEYVGGPT